VLLKRDSLKISFTIVVDIARDSAEFQLDKGGEVDIKKNKYIYIYLYFCVRVCVCIYIYMKSRATKLFI
jgi:hypothetical protein